MNVLAVDHVGLTVVDLERAVEFFADVLGFRERRRSHTGPEAVAAVTGVADAQIDHVFLAADGLDLELQLLTYRPPAAAPVAPGPDVPGSMHLALRVDDLAAVLERATARLGTRRALAHHGVRPARRSGDGVPPRPRRGHPRTRPGQPERVHAALTCPEELVAFAEAEGGGEHCHEGATLRFHQVAFDWLDTVLTP